MTGNELAAKAIEIARNYNTVYMWGVFGAPVTEQLIATKSRQYPSWYTSNRQKHFRSLIGKDYFGFDCVNLIKGIVWGWNGNRNHWYGGAAYNTNNCPDISADQMIARCNAVSTDFTKDIPIGAALWLPGHFGVYIGNGQAVEATPAWSNNVQITGSRRVWSKWGLLPFIDYTTLTIGSIVNFVGTKHYSSATAIIPRKCTPGIAKVTNIADSLKHPIHLIATPGSASTVYGWVDEADIAKIVNTVYTVRVTANALNIRSGPGTQHKVTGVITNKGLYSIVDTQNGWGRLSSGVGWIFLHYTSRI